MKALSACLLVLFPVFGGTEFDWVQKVGSGRDSLTGLATDKAGNSYVVGSTRSRDFPQPTPTSETSDIFIIKLDPAGRVIYSRLFGGSAEETPAALAVDPQGNLFVTGLTFSSDFPVTPGAFLTTLPSDPLGQRGASFVLRLNPDGTVGYATYFAISVSNPKGIAVDAAGSAYITGSTSGGLPVTPGAYRSVCDCGFVSNGFFSVPRSDGFLARFDASGSKLIYATYLGTQGTIGITTGNALAVAADGSAYVAGTLSVNRYSANGSALLAQGFPKIDVKSMALAPDGSLYVAGGAIGDAGGGTDGFRPTAGAAQTDRNVLPPLDYQFRIDQQGAIVKLDSGLRTLAATYFGGGYSSSILSTVVDASGRLLVGGSTSPHGLPTRAPLQVGFGAPGTGFAAVLSSDLSAILFSSYFGNTENFVLQSVAAEPDGSLVLGGATSDPQVNRAPGTVWVNRISIAPPQPLRIDSVRNAASRLDDPISGGETIVVRGSGFAAGARLLIGGRPLTPVVVTAAEITAILPKDLAGEATTVEVELGATRSNTVLVPVAQASPGLFSVDGSGIGQAFILNQNGTRNDTNHPAKPGEQVTIFATGVGPVSFVQDYAVTATPVTVLVHLFYARGVAAKMSPVEGLPGDVYRVTVYVPTYDEVVAVNADLRSFRFPPQVGVVLKIAGRSSQNGLAISIAP